MYPFYLAVIFLYYSSFIPGKHVLYWNFDTLDNLVLMQGNKQMDFDALVPGQVECILYGS